MASTAWVSPDSVGIHARPCWAISSPVTTATTPSSAAAADVSMLVDARVRDRRTQDRHVQHARQRDVVEEVALALDEAVVLVAADAVADAADLGRGGGLVDRGHGALAQLALGCAAAAVWIALTMFM